MTARATRLAAALVAGGALVLGLHGLTTPTQAAPDQEDAPAAAGAERAGGAVYRVRPFGKRLRPQKPQYYTVRLPRSGNYEVTLRGFLNFESGPASYQCYVVDKRKILADDLTGYYVTAVGDSARGFDYGPDESIDVSLKKKRPLLVACASEDAVLDVLKPITVTFERNGRFKNLRATTFTPPPARPGLFDGLR